MIDKLKSNSGVTIISALVALIVCVMVSTVIVYTAYSNLGRIKASKEYEQTYLAMSSAAQFNKVSLEEDEVEFIRITTQSKDAAGNLIPGSETYADSTNYNDRNKGSILSAKIGEWVVNRGVSTAASVQNASIVIENIGEISALPGVSADVTMYFESEGKSRLTVKLKLDDEPTGTETYSKITLNFPVTVVETAQNQLIEETDDYIKLKTVRTYTFEKPEVTKG